MIIPKEIIQEIKNKLDIVGIIREYIHNLKKTGKNWVGLCPFHNDHNPSLHINVDLGIFKCFSCGEGGDLIRFVERIENISFFEALKLLAKKAGVELTNNLEENNQAFQKRDELVQFNNKVINLFQHFLLKKEEANKAREYLEARGITLDLIKLFKIGYAPAGYNRLLNFFLKRGFKKEFLLTSGIFSENEKGIRPIFFDRVIFPIINHNEECIGFGGRALSNEVKPKYINTPETLLYKKSYNLYGLNITKKFIREEKKVFIVEGYVDLISCYKNGLLNIVAPCGTAITKEQISLLKRYADEIIFLMDGDDAGQKGAERALREVATGFIKRSVLILPDGMDPDDYFKKYTLDDFRKLENERIEAFDFLVKYKTRGIDKKDYQKLTEILNYLFEYIKLDENEIIQNSLIERMALLLEIDKGVIAREYITFKRKVNVVKYETNSSENSTNNMEILDELKKREIDLLLFLLQVEDVEKIVKSSSLREEHFGYKLTQDIFRGFFNTDFYDKKKNFIDYVDDNQIKKYIEERLFSYEFKQNENVLRNNLIDRIADIIKKYYDRKNEQINKKLKLAELYSDKELIKNLQEDKIVNRTEYAKYQNNLQELKYNDNKTH